jgi:translation elongation factor EF-G
MWIFAQPSMTENITTSTLPDIALIAGSLAFKEAMKQARPALLEPVMHGEVYAPDQYSGDLMGDLSSRRGREGSELRGHTVVVKALVPLAEMLSTPGPHFHDTSRRANYSMEFSHATLCQTARGKVIASHKAAHGNSWSKRLTLVSGRRIADLGSLAVTFKAIPPGSQPTSMSSTSRIAKNMPVCRRCSAKPSPNS